MTPQGQVFNQKIAQELAKEEDLVFLCGHYEGIDERALELIVTDYLSVGDYVLTGGELPAMVMVDAISRLVPGVLHNDVSAEFESFQDNLLEYPQYSGRRSGTGRSPAGPFVRASRQYREMAPEQSIIRTYERVRICWNSPNLRKRNGSVPPVAERSDCGKCRQRDRSAGWRKRRLGLANPGKVW